MAATKTNELEIYVSPLGYVTLFIDRVIVAPEDLPQRTFNKVRITEQVKR